MCACMSVCVCVCEKSLYGLNGRPVMNPGVIAEFKKKKIRTENVQFKVGDLVIRLRFTETVGGQ